MTGITILILSILAFACTETDADNGGTVLSALLSPELYQRQGRSYYDRYEDRPRCGRCDDDDDDDEDDDRGREDDRRSNRPTYGSRNDRNKYDDDDRRYDDKKSKNGTSDDDKKGSHDRDRPSKRNRNRHRYDDRDRYRPDYYDRFLRDPYRNRYERPYDDPYMPRGYPYQDRYDDFGRYDDPYRRAYDDRYDRSSYDRYGGYGPGLGRGAHDSFRPWDETYRGQAGWDDGGRGYYFASGRPDATAWGQRDYSRPVSSGWQNGYSSYRDPGYSGGYSGGYAGGYAGSSSGYAGNTGGYVGNSGVYSGVGSSGYGTVQRYPDVSSGYGSSGWRSVGYTSRPYRDQSGVTQLDNRISGQYGQNRPDGTVRYGQYGQNQPDGTVRYGQYGTNQPDGAVRYGQTSTTPGTSYLFQREDEGTKVETTEPST